MTGKRNKGQRFNKFINDYTVFDLETTGANISYAKIIEIAAVKVRNGEIVETFDTLINPRMPIPIDATRVNGITNSMVSEAPHLEEIIDDFIDFIGDDILVGHNITTFDTNLLYDELLSIRGAEFSNDFIDTIYLSKRAIKQDEIDDYKLLTLCQFFDVNTDNAHRALYDCIMTNECYQRLYELYTTEGFALDPPTNSSYCGGKRNSDETIALQTLKNILEDITSDNVLTKEEIQLLTEWVIANRHLEGNYPFDVVLAALRKVLADGIVEPKEKEELISVFRELISPVDVAKHDKIQTLEGKHCVVTGDFEYGSRSTVQSFIESKGGIIDKNVKKATDYVIVGEKGSEAWTQGNYGNKVKKALEYNANKGCCIGIIKECDFFDEVNCDE